jgi:hypothetical protein
MSDMHQDSSKILQKFTQASPEGE